jgi:hypothetical protein
MRPPEPIYVIPETNKSSYIRDVGLFLEVNRPGRGANSDRFPISVSISGRANLSLLFVVVWQVTGQLYLTLKLN